MASKEATPAASAAPAEKKAERAVPTFALEFKLLKDKIGAATTNQQVKSKVKEAFTGYGALDQCRVQGDVGQDRTVVVFFDRLFGKGQPAWDNLQKGETVNVSLYDETIPLSLSNEKPSGGGATSGTASLPKKEKKDDKKKPRGDRKDGEAKADGKSEGKDDSKDGKRPPRGPKKEEVKGPSLQRGRANIGGKLGPVSKIRLAKIEQEKKKKEIEEKKKAGTYVEEVKVVEEDPSVHLVKKGGKDVKKEEGKKGDAKKEGGKKEAGKKEEGKKEAAKAPAKKK